MRAMEFSHKSLNWVIAIGVFLMIIGIIALSLPVFTTFTSDFAFGVLIILGGIGLISSLFVESDKSKSLMQLSIGTLSIIIGILMIVYPEAALFTITLLMAIFFLTLGLFRILNAVIVKFSGWGWVLLNGVITFILGLLIAAHWPESSFFIIGIFIGIEFLVTGFLLTVNTLMIKKMKKTTSHTLM